MFSTKRLAKLFWEVAAIVVALLIVAALPSRCRAQTPTWPDGALLEYTADLAHIPRAPVLALAWLESEADTNPALRGHHCWHPAGGGNPAVHSPNCEVGRFQIKPSTAAGRCPEQNIFTTVGNFVCFALMFHEDMVRYNTMEAVRRHHGGTSAQNALYVKRALRVMLLVATTQTVNAAGLEGNCPVPTFQQRASR